MSQLNATLEPTPVPIPIFDVRNAREAQKVFRDLHLKAWRKNEYPLLASQFDVPLVVARVLRSFHGHCPAPEEDNDQKAVSRSLALQGILNVPKNRDAHAQGPTKSGQTKGASDIVFFCGSAAQVAEEPIPDLLDINEDDAKAKPKVDCETAGLSLGERAEFVPWLTMKWCL